MRCEPHMTNRRWIPESGIQKRREWGGVTTRIEHTSGDTHVEPIHVKYNDALESRKYRYI